MFRILFFVLLLANQAFGSDHLEELKRRWEKEPQNKVVVSEYLTALQYAQQNQIAQQVAGEYFRRIPEKDIVLSENWIIVSSFIQDIKQSEFELIVRHADKFQANFGQMFQEYIISLVENELIKIDNIQEIGILEEHYFNILKNTQQAEFDKVYYDMFLEMYYFKIRQDWQNYIPLMVGWIEKYHAQNWYELSIKAVELSEFNTEYLPKALQWSQKALQLHHSEFTLYLYAKVLFKQNRVVEAKKYLEEAKKSATNSEILLLIQDLEAEIG